MPLQLRTVRTKTHKCTFDLDSGAGELYDLMNDPEEMVNRFDDPAYAKTRQDPAACACEKRIGSAVRRYCRFHGYRSLSAS